MVVRTVTGNVNTLAGVNIPNATFSLVPETYVFGSTSTDVVFGDLKTIVADGNGDVSFDLHEGKYVGRISTTQGPKTFRLIVDSEGPWELGRLVGPLDESNIPPLISAAFDAADRAEAAAVTAETAAAGVEFPVSYAPQSLDAGQQAQARDNISAAAATRVVAAGIGLTGGGDLTTDRTINADLSDKATAEAGINNATLMTPLRTNEAIAALGGKVLQVVQANTSSAVTIASTTFTDIGLSAVITPRSTSSQILCLVNPFASHTRNTDVSILKIELRRGTTTIAEMYDFALSQNATLTERRGLFSIFRLDAPSTASSVTYNIRGCVVSTADSGQCVFQVDGIESRLILLEIAT